MERINTSQYFKIGTLKCHSILFSNNSNNNNNLGIKPNIHFSKAGLIHLLFTRRILFVPLHNLKAAEMSDF
jgi:hypothetical protein